MYVCVKQPWEFIGKQFQLHIFIAMPVLLEKYGKINNSKVFPDLFETADKIRKFTRVMHCEFTCPHRNLIRQLNMHFQKRMYVVKVFYDYF